jgi:hypothetical protein
MRERDANTVEAAVRHARYACPTLWIVPAHYNETELRVVRDVLDESGAFVNEEDFVGVQLFAVRRSEAGRQAAGSGGKRIDSWLEWGHSL